VTAAIPTGATEERIPLRGIRRKIAQQMVKAKFTAPDFFYADEADMTDLVAYRSEVAPLMKAQGVKLTYLAFLVKAVVSALKAYPEMNASLDDDAQEIVIKRDYHIGIATAAEHGLVVPVIKHADHLGLRAIAQEIERLSTAVREGKATPQELSGGTFTITNIGAIGGLVCAPIINHPEVGILGFNKIYQKPVVYQGEIVPRWVTTLSLSCDHRVVDGAEGARFVSHILQLLQNPKLLLLE
jgi:pyruvate dehydrogenase E2 component (dihydrolipoamide acetyltransferase)